jgi:hypothetical protein
LIRPVYSARRWQEIIADVLATPGRQIVSLPFSQGLDKGRHVYVAVCPITPDGSSGLPAPTAVDGRWAIRQDK